MNDTKLSLSRARRPPDDESFRRLYAREDAYSRYDTGEPHSLDSDGAVLVGYVDPITRWQMYKFNDDYVQPKNGNAARYDPDAAAAQRKRGWKAAELAAAEEEFQRERYADEMFPEPPPKHPDNETEPSKLESQAGSDDCSSNPSPTQAVAPSAKEKADSSAAVTDSPRCDSPLLLTPQFDATSLASIENACAD
eukprot:4175402-Pleurochrysis_carterae.AAC.2